MQITNPTSTPYAGITLTLTPGTRISIWAALKAIDPTIAGFAKNYRLQADAKNGTNAILIGDSQVLDSPQRCSYGLIPGQFAPLNDVKNAVFLANMYALVASAATGAYLLNVEIMLG